MKWICYKKLTTDALSSINHFWGFSWQCELCVGLCVLPLYTLHRCPVSKHLLAIHVIQAPRVSFIKGVKSWAWCFCIHKCYAWNPRSRTVFLKGMNPKILLHFIVNVIPMLSWKRWIPDLFANTKSTVHTTKAPGLPFWRGFIQGRCCSSYLHVIQKGWNVEPRLKYLLELIYSGTLQYL